MRGIWLWLSLPRYDTIHKLPPPGGGGALMRGERERNELKGIFFWRENGRVCVGRLCVRVGYLERKRGWGDIGFSGN